MLYARSLGDLIAELERLPGIGPKSAQRLAFHLLRQPDTAVERLVDVIQKAKASLRFCRECQNFSEEELCEVCRDPRRHRDQICVVGDPKDVSAVERVNEYRGLYHVLHGVMNPMEGIGPDQIRVRELLARITDEVKEVILATNPTVEGDATALYLAKVLKPLGVRVTRIAHGMPIGGELDFADSATLLSAIEYRREM